MDDEADVELPKTLLDDAREVDVGARRIRDPHLDVAQRPALLPDELGGLPELLLVAPVQDDVEPASVELARDGAPYPVGGTGDDRIGVRPVVETVQSRRRDIREHETACAVRASQQQGGAEDLEERR